MPTLNDIILDCREELGEVPGSVPFRNPLTWERHIRNAMDEVCRRSWCHYTTLSYDLTAGQAPVVSGACSCPLFEIEEARVSLAGGATLGYLEILTPRAFPNHWLFSWDWRNVPAALPFALVVAGLNNLRVYPAPDFSSLVAAYTDLALGTGGLTASSAARPFLDSDTGLTLTPTAGTGFTLAPVTVSSVSGGVATLSASAGSAGSTGGAATLKNGGLLLTGFATTNGTDADGSQLVALTDEFPLPQRAIECVKYGAKMRRAEQYPKEYGDRWRMLSDRYRETLGDLTAEARDQSAANSRAGTYT